MSRYTCIQDAARDALLIQNASNLSGVIHAWANMQGAVLDDVGAGNLHAVNILMLSKIVSLMGVTTDCIGGVTVDGQDMFKPAYEWANKEQ